MKVSAKFVDGPLAGKMATISVPEFKVNMLLNIQGYVYQVNDGPAARFHEKTGQENNSLMILLNYFREIVK